MSWDLNAEEAVLQDSMEEHVKEEVQENALLCLMVSEHVVIRQSKFKMATEDVDQ